MKKDRGYHLSFNDGIIKPNHDLNQKVAGFPWIFSGDGGQMICPLWQTLHWGTFQYLPAYCAFNCHKVMIIPNTVKELFEVHEFLEDYGFNSKAGLDMRPYTFGMLKAFIYCDNYKTAKHREKIAKSELNGCIIFTKKGCTEFENKLPSDKWKKVKPDINLESALKNDVDHGPFIDGVGIKLDRPFCQPEWAKDIIRLHWAQSAYASGDPHWKNTPYAEFVVTSKNPVTY